MAGYAMFKLGYVAMPSIDKIVVVERHTGRWQLVFDGLVFMFSLMLLPGLWHRCDCLDEKQPAVKELVFAQLWISRNGQQGEHITL